MQRGTTDVWWQWLLLGAVNPHPWADQGEIEFYQYNCPLHDSYKIYLGPLLPAKFRLHRFNVSPMRGEKPKNRSVSKNNTSSFALHASRLLSVKSEKHHTFSCHTNVCRSIPTMHVIEEVRAITVPLPFLDPVSSLVRGDRKFGWKCPHRGKLFIILSLIELKQPNLAIFLCRLRTRINSINFIRIVQGARGARPLWANILVKFIF